MIYDFRRQFRLLERLFPGSGAARLELPNAVDGTVTPTWNMAQARTGDVIFDSLDLTAAVIVAGNATLDSSSRPVPYGRTRIVTHAGIRQTAAGSRAYAFGISQSTTQTRPDEWGTWFLTDTSTRNFGGGSIPSDATLHLPQNPFPFWFPDSDVFVRFEGLPGLGEVVTFQFTFIELPTELLHVELR